MATRLRSVSRPAISLLRTFTCRPTTPISPNLLPRSSLSFSRIKPQMGCLESMLPFHSAVASARMTSRLCLGSAGSRTMCQGTVWGSNPGV
ncbi:hypothetical protein QJS04_geneDACA015666 [Acorus gramineus]|uniref:Uncharacterized protein n=1 Tax=Acorus gramineus TaxID=55184 RepID=A0AAV9AKV7_ACOGR|nr:hypothetical protein QJS04_geneDACA015666 [Acorus gramineus]